MLNYKDLDKKFDDVLNSISHEEVRKWDFFDKFRLETERLVQLCFEDSIHSSFVSNEFNEEFDGLIDDCSDNRFALAA